MKNVFFSSRRRRAVVASRRRRVQKRCQFEALEGRWLMAGDLAATSEPDMLPIQQLFASSAANLPAPVWSPAAASSSAIAAASTPQDAEGEAEGEPAPDLVAFAKALKTAGVKFYGADWCPFCTEQKEAFEDGKRYLPFEEITNADRTLTAAGLQVQSRWDAVAGGRPFGFPVWEFPGANLAGIQDQDLLQKSAQTANSVMSVGTLTLQQISLISGVAIPTSEAPSFFPLPSTVEVKAGSPLHLAIDAYDPNGGPLTITASSTNPSVVATSVPTGNRSLKIDVQSYGPMVFHLFEDKAPDVTGRIIQLAQSGFYNQTASNLIKFHRVVDNFVIQGGDPTGTGGGGSTLGDIDDQYHPDLQHNQSGVLSYAKGGDDTNDSQFFITEGAQRNLDFNHSVLGQLVEGDAVREGISRVPVNADGQQNTADDQRPTRDVRINSVTVFQDQENGVVMLKAPHGVTGTAQVTITVTDAQGHTATQTITVNVVADNANSAPFLNPIQDVTTTVNTPVTIQLSSTDIENNPRFYDAAVAGSTSFSFNVVDNSTGQITVTPPSGFVGTLQLLVGVRGASAADTVDQFDTQTIDITVAPAAPTALDLLDASDTGSSATDNITKSKQVQVRVEGVTTSAFVTLLAGNTVVGQATASGNTVVINADLASLGDGQHTLRATQRLNNVTSGNSPTLTVTVDSAVPTFTSTPPTAAPVGQVFSYDTQSNEEAAGNVTYSLVNAPTGVTINASTGVVTWTPTAGQIGNQSFSVQALDKAGNSAQQTLNVAVQGTEQVRYRLETTKLDGTAASTFNVNEEFFLNVYVSDRRASAQGVLSAYLDVLLPGQLVEVVGTPEFGNHFLNDREVDVSTAGLINEAGATAGSEVTGNTEFLLLRARLKGVNGGQGTLQGEAADDAEHTTLVIGQQTAVPNDQINFGSATIAIVTPFTAVNDVFNVDEDGSGTLDVRANDTFPTGQVSSLRISAVGNPSNNGQVSVTQDGRISYQPAANYFGVETFTYTITDDVNGSTTGTVTVQVQPMNDPPTAVNDSYTGNQAVVEDSSNRNLMLLANDSASPDVGETLRITAVGARSNGGTVTIAPNGTHVIYTPAANFNGQETFTYTISDGNGGTATATVTVQVTGTNDPPVANFDTFTVAEDSAQASHNVLANDNSGVDQNETLTITTVAALNNAQGALIIASDGKSVLYTPPANFVGQEVFRYVISDGNGGTAESRVTFTVTGVNDPPTANDDTGASGRFTATKNAAAPVTLNVLRNDSFAPDTGETLTITAVSAGSQGGTITISADNKTISYKAKADFEGTETFTYTISDGNGGTDTATVEVLVRAFIPSVLGGAVYIDADGDGVFDANELPVSGVEVKLTGQDDFGATVSKSVRSGANGAYQFTDLAPGNYTIVQTQPAFLVDGTDRIGSQGGTVANDRFTIDLNENTQGLGNNFGERGRAAQFVTIRDLFASTPKSSLLLIVNGNSTTYVGIGGWQQYHSAAASLSADKATWELSVENGDQVEMKTALPNRPSRHLELLGSSGNNTLLRVFGPIDALNFQPVSSSTSGGSGEGEPTAAVAHAALAEGEPSAPAAADTVLANAPAGEWNAPVDDDLLARIAQVPERKQRTGSALERLFASHR